MFYIDIISNGIPGITIIHYLTVNLINRDRIYGLVDLVLNIARCYAITYLIKKITTS